jgi:hypothetical protein
VGAPFECPYEVGGGLRWLTVDEEWVVYCASTGAMSVLDAFKAAVLDSVERGAQTVGAVVATLVREAGLVGHQDVLTQVTLVLEQLATAGFLNRLAK